MSEVQNTTTLAALQRRIAELEADIRLISGNIQYLERAVGDCACRDRAEQERRHREIAEEVEADLFAEDLANPADEELGSCLPLDDSEIEPSWPSDEELGRREHFGRYDEEISEHLQNRQEDQ